MKIPALFHGRAGQAKTRVRKLAKAIVQQRDFDVFKLEPWLDTSQVDGLILAGREITLPWAENFHCYALSRAIAASVATAELHRFMTDWVLWCLEEPWRFVCVLGDDSISGLSELDPKVLRQYVDAGVRYWPTLLAEGRRFGPTTDDSGNLWKCWASMKFALANMGVPTDEVIAGSPEGPAGLLKYIDQRKLDT